MEKKQGKGGRERMDRKQHNGGYCSRGREGK